MKLIIEKSKKGRVGYTLKKLDVPEQDIDIPEELIRKEEPNLPEVNEVEVIRHLNELESRNFSVDRGFYPLGSCTMKYNPVINEELAALDEFKFLHPYIEEEHVQGILELMYNLQKYLSEITGMDYFTLQPAAGAHGELTGMLIVHKYFKDKGIKKTKVIVPDSAHGTNPASAKMAGYEVIEVKSNKYGMVDIEDLKKIIDEEVAAIMLTNPNTLGIFEKDILEIQKIAKENDVLLYYDGANLNAIMGKIRPGDMGFDIVHLNLHKTFSTPHGMGGPGSGPVGVKEYLKDYLPVPIVERDEKSGKYYFKYDIPKSIGRVRSFYGNILVAIKAYSYILRMGPEGLKKVSEIAVLNANYLRKKLSEYIPISHEGICKHEFVASAEKIKKEYNVKALDIAKRLIDYGFHPPTMYFPLIVPEALMIEPTETESKETLDAFAEAIKKIVEEAKTEPQLLKEAPHKTPVRRLDETRANRKIKIRW